MFTSPACRVAGKTANFKRELFFVSRNFKSRDTVPEWFHCSISLLHECGMKNVSLLRVGDESMSRGVEISGRKVFFHVIDIKMSVIKKLAVRNRSRKMTI